MSVELRIRIEGECHCGTVREPDEPPSLCEHIIECDWGDVDFSHPRPDRDEVGHLILATRWSIDRAADGVSYLFYRDCDSDGRTRWQEYTVTTSCDRTFLHTAWPIYNHGEGNPAESGTDPPLPIQRWTWELFDAHWFDGFQQEIYIGRWPD